MDRRGFIKFAAGAVVGLHLTPIPWKLMDDVAIWTQNWPWVPEPEGGATSYRNVSGGLSDCGCGLRIRLIEGKRAVTVSGNPDHPVSQGGLCPLCASSLQYFYNKGVRISSPMKREGTGWKPISWNEAINLLADKLKTERNKGKAYTAALITGGADTATNALLRRFMAAYGSPNVLHAPSCEDTNDMIRRLMFGQEGTMGYDLEEADFVISFGSGIIEGWGSPVASMRAFEKWRESSGANHKATLVQVEPNLSITASKADVWLPVNPGTEGALALGLAHLIIQEGLYQKALLEEVFGFDDGTDPSGETFLGFKNFVLKEYPPERVAQITGIPKADIVSLARAFAGAKRPLAVAGKGKGDMPGSFYEFMAIYSLNALVGAVQRPGGVGCVPKPPLAQWDQPVLDQVAERSLNMPRLDGAASLFPFTHSLLHRFARTINRRESYPINILIVDGSNPAYAAPNSSEFKQALDKIPFIACFSTFWDETAHRAHLLLPAPTFLEKWDDRVNLPSISYPIYQVASPVFEPLLKTKPTGEVMLALAQALGGSVASSFGWKDMEEAVKSRAAGLYEAKEGMLAEPGSLGKASNQTYKSMEEFWKALVKTGCWYNPSRKIGMAKTAYGTPSGRLELYSQTIKKGLTELSKKEENKAETSSLVLSAVGDARYMAHYEASDEERNLDAHPLFHGNGFTQLLMMPCQFMYVSSGPIASAPFMTKIFPDTLLRGKDLFVYLNPRTAAEMKLTEGDRVLVRAARGKLKARIHLFEGVRPGILAVPEGFGHTGFDPFMQGKGSNLRDVVDVQSDALSGLPLWWGTRVNVLKI
jgi:anaerobic selenocysteine-containing dehydrogenase